MPNIEIEIDRWKKHSEFFNQSDVSAIHAATTNILTERLRNALSFRITMIGNYVGALAAWGKITWVVKCNGVPIEPFTAQKSQIGQQGIPQPITMDFIFPPASILTVDAINADGVTDYIAGIVIKGEYGTA